jgi:hypothetical protein
VDRDQGAVQQGRPGIEVAGECLRELVGGHRVELIRDHADEVPDGRVGGGLVDANERRERPLGSGSSQRDEDRQQPVAVGEPAWPFPGVVDIGRVYAGGDVDVGGGRA